MNKVLVKLYVPIIDGKFDVWLPINKKIYKVRDSLNKLVSELCIGYYVPSKNSKLYEKDTGKPYNVNLNVKECDIINGTEMILI